MQSKVTFRKIEVKSNLYHDFQSKIEKRFGNTKGGVAPSSKSPYGFKSTFSILTPILLPTLKAVSKDHRVHRFILFLTDVQLWCEQ